MPDPTLSSLGANLGVYIRANRGGARQGGDQPNILPGIQRLGIVTSNAGETLYLYYNPATHTIVWSNTVPTDAGVTG